MLGTPNSPGIMVLTLNDLFFKMKATENDVIYSVTMSYMEVSSFVNWQKVSFSGLVLLKGKNVSFCMSY